MKTQPSSFSDTSMMSPSSSSGTTRSRLVHASPLAGVDPQICASFPALTNTQYMLCESARTGSEEWIRQCLTELISSGGSLSATVNVLDPQSGDSPLMIACRQGYARCVQILLDNGAKNDPHPDFGQTALHSAVCCGQLECAQVILQVAERTGADHIITKLTDQFGQTPLHCASFLGDSSMCQLLLEHCADTSCIDSYGQTALHLSCGSQDSGRQSSECLALLLDHGGDSVMEVRDIYGNTALHHAAFHGRVDCVRLLLETAADVNAKNNKGLTPYNLATMRGHHQIGLLLMDYRSHHTTTRAHRSITSNTQSELLSPTTIPSTRRSMSKPVGFMSPAQSIELFTRNLTKGDDVLDDGEFSSTPLTSERSGFVLIDSTDNLPHTPVHHTANFFEDSGTLPRPHMISSPSTTRQRSLSTASSNRSRPTSVQFPSNISSLEISLGSFSDSATFSSFLPPAGPTNVSQPSSNSVIPPSAPVEESRHTEKGIRTYLKEPLGPLRSSGSLSFVSDDQTNSALDDMITPVVDSMTESSSYTEKTYYSHSLTESTEYEEIKVISDLQSTEEFEETQEYAEPLECFRCLSRDWHVYCTEDGDRYFLDMANEHSQWDDPRTYGLIFTDAYDSIDGDSSSRHTDSPPPLSAMIRSADTSPVRATHPGMDSPLAVWDPTCSDTMTTPKKESPQMSSFKKSLHLFRQAENRHTPIRSVAETIGSTPITPLPLSKELIDEELKESIDMIYDTSRSNVSDKLQTPDKIDGSNVVDQTTDLSTRNEPTFAEVQQYTKFFRDGFTLQDIRTYLEKEGRNTVFIRSALSLLDDLEMLDDSITALPMATILTPSKSTLPSPPKSPVPTAINLDDLVADPLYSKYVRMSRMGVPPQSVIAKMKLDDVTVEVISRMQIALGIEEPTPPHQTKAVWRPVPEERLKNSIWALSSDEDAAQSLLAEQELRQLETLFRTTPPSSKPANPKLAQLTQQKFALRLLEGKRAQNISIGLVAFRSLGSYSDLCKAVCSMDTYNELLTADHLANLAYLLPTSSEVKGAHRLIDVVHPAEQFIQTTLIFYPELPVRLHIFTICLQFSAQTASAERRMKAVMDCANAVLSSSKLARLLQKLLVVSRVMMDGKDGARALRATGAETSSLLEQIIAIGNMRAADRKTSLIEFVIRGLLEKGESGLLDVIVDLTQIADPTTPLASLEVFAEIEALEKTLITLQTELDRMGGDPKSIILSSPTAQKMSDTYTEKLSQYLTEFYNQMTLLRRRAASMQRKIVQLMEFFGEDSSKRDTLPVFLALREFRRLVEVGKDTVEWRMTRDNSHINN